ncbi:MAG: glycosyltransferase family 2 protein [Chitinophagaceae bacterium]
MEQQYPLVSVLMTAYNREKYIAEAIESVLASTYPNWELIIVDDGSKDKTVAIAKQYASVDKRIKLYINDKNLGDYPNRNKAAAYANGEWMMFVDSDDKTLPNGIKDCVDAMHLYPNCSFGIQLKENTNTDPFYRDGNEAISKHFFEKPSLMSGPTGTIQRVSFFKQLNAYPTKYGPANDMYYNIKAAIQGVVFLPFEFNYYRIHEGQEINNKYSYLYNNFKYLRDAIVELPLPFSEKQKQWILNKNRRRLVVNLVKYLVKTKNISATFKAIKLAEITWKDVLLGIFH